MFYVFRVYRAGRKAGSAAGEYSSDGSARAAASRLCANVARNSPPGQRIRCAILKGPRIIPVARRATV